MIRDATEGDVSALVQMGKAFHGMSGYAEVIEFAPASFEATVLNMIADNNSVILVMERNAKIVGMAAGQVYPIYFNHAHKTSQELFWWVSPDARGSEALALKAALEYAVNSMGAASLAMMNMPGLRDKALARLYRLHGYKSMEQSFIKVF